MWQADSYVVSHQYVPQKQIPNLSAIEQFKRPSTYNYISKLDQCDFLIVSASVALDIATIY